MPIRTLSTSLPTVQFEQGGNEGVSGLGNALSSLINLGPQLARIDAERKQQQLDNAARDQQLGLEQRRTDYEGRRVGQEGERIGLARTQHEAEVARLQAEQAQRVAQQKAEMNRQAALHGVSPQPLLLQGPPSPDGQLPSASVDDLLAQKVNQDAAAAREHQTKLAEMNNNARLGAAQIRADAQIEVNGHKMTGDDYNRRAALAGRMAQGMNANNLALMTGSPEDAQAAYMKAYDAAFNHIVASEEAAKGMQPGMPAGPAKPDPLTDLLMKSGATPMAKPAPPLLMTPPR